MTDVIVHLNEAREEARRLTKIHGRDVEVKAVECCDFDKTCGCGGEGLRYVLVFSCGHDAESEPHTECEIQDCVHREYLASIEREEQLEAVTK